MAKTKLPDARGLVKLVGAAYNNATNYHAVASGLLAAGSTPLALSNASLGFEELGKAGLCLTALTMPPSVRAEFAAEFGKLFGDHVAKASFAHFGFLAFVSPQAPRSFETLIDEVGKAAVATHAAKMRGLYVDVDDGGTIHEPAEVARLDAEVMVGLLGRMLEEQSQLRLYALADPDDVIDLYRQIWAGDLAAVIERVANADPDAFLAEARAVARGEAPLPGWVREMYPALVDEAEEPVPAALAAVRRGRFSRVRSSRSGLRGIRGR
jgi:AbiV family abortive infection protein